MNIIEARILIETRDNIKRITNEINNMVVRTETLTANLKKSDIIQEKYDLSTRKRDCIECSMDLAGLLRDYKTHYERLHNDIANTIPPDIESHIQDNYMPLEYSQADREKQKERAVNIINSQVTTGYITPNEAREEDGEDSKPFDTWFMGLMDTEKKTIMGVADKDGDPIELWGQLSYDERRDLFLSHGDDEEEGKTLTVDGLTITNGTFPGTVDPTEKAIEELTDVKGIGTKTAEKLIAQDITSENQLWELMEKDKVKLREIVGKSAFRKIENG